MGIDLDKIREMHEAMQSSGGQGGGGGIDLSKFMQVSEGSNVVRILPPKEEDEDFYSMTKFHRIKGVGQDGRDLQIHCRKVHNEKCPLCDLYFGIWDHINKTGDQRHKPFANYLRAKDRYYVNVVNRESGEVKVLSHGKILFSKIIAAMVDPDYGDITDLEAGHDFKIIKIMEGQWPKYDQSAPRPKSTPAGTKKEIKVWMDELHNLKEMVKLEEYDDLKKIAMMYDPLAPKGRTSEEAEEATSSSEATDDEYSERLKS